jgi:hypothetical protein
VGFFVKRNMQRGSAANASTYRQRRLASGAPYFLFIISITCPTIMYIVQYHRIRKSQLKSTTTLYKANNKCQVAKEVAQQVAISLSWFVTMI